jgi:hypothetical protein
MRRILAILFSAACAEPEPVLEPVGPAVLEVIAPARGAFVTDDVPVTVTGRIVNPSRARSLTSGGQAIPWSADGSFSFPYPAATGVNVVSVRLVDDMEERQTITWAFLYGTFGWDLGPDDPALAMQLDRSALAHLARLGANAVAAKLNDDPAFQNLVFYDVSSCDHLVIERITVDGATATLDPAGDRLRLHSELDTNPNSQLTVDFVAVDCTSLGVDLSGVMRATSATIDGDVVLAADEQFHVDLVNADVVLNDYDINLDRDLFGLGGEIVQWLTSGGVTDALESGLQDSLGPMLEDQLNAFVGTRPLGSFETPAGPAELLLDLLPHPRIRFDDGLAFALRGAARVDGADGTEPVHEGLGPFYSGVAAAAPGGAQLSAALSLDRLNEAFYGAWELGSIDQAVDLSQYLALFGEPFSELATLRLQIDAALPPVLLGEDGHAEVQVGELDGTIWGARDGEPEADLGVIAINVFAAFRVDHYAGSPDAIALKLEDPVLEVAAVRGGDLAEDLAELIEELGPSIIRNTVNNRPAISLPSALDFADLDVLAEPGLLEVKATLAE